MEGKNYKIDKNIIIKNESGNNVNLLDIKVGSCVTVKIVFGKIKEITINQSSNKFNRPNMNDGNLPSS